MGSFDPTRTILLRRKWIADINNRVRKLRGEINQFVIEEDCFALAPMPKLKLNAERRAYEFKTDPAKVDSFKGWFQERVDAGVLTTDSKGDPWTNEYVDSAYRKGAVRAYTDTHKEALAEDPIEYEGGKSQFLRDAFASPEAVSKIKLIHTRAYDQLKGYTEAMAQSTSRILSDGIAHGWGARQIARELNKNISFETKKRALVIARTETIHAHAEGQLDSFERLGIEQVGVEIEWSTAGDDRVCPQCAPREGDILTLKEARGQIPYHPNCRCAWKPAPDPSLQDAPFQAAVQRIEKSFEEDKSVLSKVAKKIGKKKTKGKKLITKYKTEYEESVQKFEGSIAALEYEVAGVYTEAGSLLFQKSGGETSVRFTDEELALMEGGILAHNHPGENGPSFSSMDILLMRHTKLREIRAVTRVRNYRHVARLTAKGSKASLKKLRSIYEKTEEEVFQEFNKRIRGGTMRTKQAQQEHLHEVWTRVADQGWLEYRRESDV